MRHALVLSAAAIMVAACAAPDATLRLPVRPIEPVGPHASVSPDIVAWSLYRQFNFDPATVDVSTSDLPKLNEIVAYLETDSSLDVGIDGTLAHDQVSQAERDLSDGRAAAVRRGLMDSGAGVASYKIMMGSFADPRHRRAGQILVLVRQRVASIPVAP